MPFSRTAGVVSASLFISEFVHYDETMHQNRCECWSVTLSVYRKNQCLSASLQSKGNTWKSDILKLCLEKWIAHPCSTSLSETVQVWLWFSLMTSGGKTAFEILKPGFWNYTKHTNKMIFKNTINWMVLQMSKVLVLPFHIDTVLMAASFWSSGSLAVSGMWVTAKWPPD